MGSNYAIKEGTVTHSNFASFSTALAFNDNKNFIHKVVFVNFFSFFPVHVKNLMKQATRAAKQE